MSLLNGKQLIQNAQRLEVNGEKFYREWARKAVGEEEKRFFLHMADEEARHRRLFENLEAQMTDKPMDLNVSDDYRGYMQAFTDETLFNETVYGREMESVTTLAAAVEFAMRQELDSLLFYLELKVFVHHEQEKVIEEIINEERRHYVSLLKLKRELTS